ncbi:uncharacterized protein [Haliotis asinina]|uniref:uncharacterized protein isoform X1 n=1 Tax=Haliotis asinina TaxID=109174 RepID=UPI003531820E
MHLLLAVVCVHLTVLGQTDILGHLVEKGQRGTMRYLVEKGHRGQTGRRVEDGGQKRPLGQLVEEGHTTPLIFLVENGHRGQIGRRVEDGQNGPLGQLVEEAHTAPLGFLVGNGHKGQIGRLGGDGQKGSLGQLVEVGQTGTLGHLAKVGPADPKTHLEEEGQIDLLGRVVNEAQTDTLGLLMEDRETSGHLMIRVKGKSSQASLIRGKRDTYIVDGHNIVTNMMAGPSWILTPESQTGIPRDPGQSTSILKVDSPQVRTRRTVIGRYPMCPRGCTSCSAVNGCVTCERRYFLFLYRRNMRQTGMCTPSCPPGYFGVRQHFHNRCVSMLPLARRKIIKCQVSHCRSCFTRQYCTQCYRPRIAHRGDCIDSCPTGLHLANYSSECRSRVDCLVGPWTTWSACRPRGRGCGQRRRFRVRSRSIIESPSPNGGTACPPLRERRGCQGARGTCRDPCRRRKRRKRKWRGKRRKERGRRRGHSRGSDARKRRRCRSGRKSLQRCRRRRHCRGGEG